jgi:uncharacterized protein
MDISFDPAKRDKTLTERGVDFAGVTATVQDMRRDYGEDRYITIGQLRGRRVVLVWPARGDTRRIISMRYAHASEEAQRFDRLD